MMLVSLLVLYIVFCFLSHSYLKKQSNNSKIFSLHELKCACGKPGLIYAIGGLLWKGLILLCSSAVAGDILMLYFEDEREGQFGCEPRIKNQNGAADSPVNQCQTSKRLALILQLNDPPM